MVLGPAQIILSDKSNRIHDKSLLPLLPYLRPRQNGRHFADGMLKYIFLIEIDIVSIKISQTLLPRSDHSQHWFR